MVEQVFLSPQVKRSLIISNKLVYTSCLTSCQNAVTLSYEKLGKIMKISKLHRIIAYCLDLSPNVVSTSKNL